MKNRLIYCLFYIPMFFIWNSCTSSDKKEVEASINTVLPNENNDIKAIILEYTDFSHELISNGTVSAGQKADLRFESSEIVEKIYVKNGQRVSKGQKIAMLSQFKLQNSIKQSLDNLEKAKLELQDVLISQGYVLRDSLKIPAEIMKIAKTKSNYDNSIVQYDLARYNLKHSVLYAPFDGVVANLFSKEHNTPPASDPFCSVIGNQSLEADFMVLESELPLIHIGDQVQISPFSFSDYTTGGKVNEINPVVNENGMVRIKATITKTDKNLYDGMNIKVRIQRSVGKQLVIPKEALVLRNNKKVVFTVKGGKAYWNYVQTGLENSTVYVITEGLNQGDSVIYSGNLNLSHEAPVKILKQ